MRKYILLSMFVAATSVATSAFADVHFEFGVPIQVTKKGTFKSSSGYSSSLLVDIDSSTALGLYGEDQSFTGGTVSVTAFRFQKAVTDTVNVGLNLGEATTTVNAADTGNLADIYGNVKLLSTKGKLNSYLNAELKYRTAKLPTTDMSGLQFMLGAGLNF